MAGRNWWFACPLRKSRPNTAIYVSQNRLFPLHKNININTIRRKNLYNFFIILFLDSHPPLLIFICLYRLIYFIQLPKIRTDAWRVKQGVWKLPRLFSFPSELNNVLCKSWTRMECSTLWWSMCVYRGYGSKQGEHGIMKNTLVSYKK